MKKTSVDILDLLIQLYADQEGVEIKIHKEEKNNDGDQNQAAGA